MHEKKILLIEDDPDFQRPIIRWLKEAGYVVSLASSYKLAKDLLKTDHFHMMIVDIRLNETDEGIQITHYLADKRIIDVLPFVVLSANIEANIFKFPPEVRRGDFIEKKPGYKKELLSKVQEKLFCEVKINFELNYLDDSEQILPEVVDAVEWKDGKPEKKILNLEMKDMLGKLFFNAKSIHISRLDPGLSGSAILLVSPELAHGVGQPRVVKINQKGKIKIESGNYEEFVQPYLPNNTFPQLKEAHSISLGSLEYTFAEQSGVPMYEFDKYYNEHSCEEIICVLKYLFENVFKHWYDHYDKKEFYLPSLYCNAFDLSKKRFETAIQSLYNHVSLSKPTFNVDWNGATIQIINPIIWLQKNREQCVLQVCKSVTHGDLNGRNILVDDQRRCWVIDFYRTDESHILRDFVVLETDIKYRLMKKSSLEEFKEMELFLNKSILNQKINAQVLPEKIRKAATVIMYLRNYGFRLINDTNVNHIKKELLLSILMGTLNVIRLQHIELERKNQALLSTTLLCQELENLL